MVTIALDFVNTLGGSHALGPQPHDEHLRGYRDLLAWSLRAGTLGEAMADRLDRAAGADPRQAGRAFAEALGLRELPYSVLRPIADGSAPLGEPLAELCERESRQRSRGPLDRLKMCGECRWLFIDRSRNRSRRWCSMEDCGTSVKMRRYVERRRVRRGARSRSRSA